MNCDLCNSNKNQKFYDGILLCNECGHIYADLNISEDELKQIYDSDYFHGEEYSDYIKEKYVIQKNFKRLIKILDQYINERDHKRLLEIGSAYGFFLEILGNRFELLNGVEISKEATSYARNVLNLDVSNVDLLSWDFNKGSYDVVCMWDTLEHLYSPNKFLEKISNNISNGGILAFTTLDIGSAIAKIRKQNWRQIHPPSHAHYFNRQTIQKLLNKNGFKLIKFRHFGRHRSIDMISHIIFVQRLKLPIIYKILKFLKITEITTYLNLFDEMLIIARKVDHVKEFKNRVVIHADDFGLSERSSDNIIECFGSSLTRTSIMSNGLAFDYAINKFLNLKDKKLGIHINITEGYAVSKEKDLNMITNSKGEFRLSFIQLIAKNYFLNKEDKLILIEQIRNELDAQIDQVLKKLPSNYEIHIDSHHYIHCIPFIVDIILELKTKYNISSVRLPNELFSFHLDFHNIKNLFSSNILKFLVLKFLSISLRKKLIKFDINFNEYFIGVLFSGKVRLKDIIKSLNKIKNLNASVEILFHPGIIGDHEVSNLNVGRSSSNFYSSDNRNDERNILLNKDFHKKIDEYLNL